MSKFGRYLAIIVFIFFEVYAGVRLLTAPVDFSNSAVVTFGIVMLLVGAISLYWALTLKSKGMPFQLGLVCAIINLILGIICIFWSQSVVNAFPVFAVFYGISMIVMGVNKLGDYFILKANGLPHPMLWMIGAVLTIILGVVVMLNPFGAVETAITVSGYMLIFSGVFDLFVFIFSFFM